MSQSRASLGTIAALAVLAYGLGEASRPCFGDILAGSYRTGELFRLNDQTGAQLVPPILPAATGLDSISGLAVGPSGNLYVSNQDQTTGGGDIHVFNGDTIAPVGSGILASLNSPTNLTSQPGPLRFGPGGNIYVSDFGGSTVRVFDPTTGAESSPAAMFLNRVGGLTFAPNGDMYVGNFGTNSVIRVHNGVMSTFIAPGNGPIATPSSLLILPDGDLLVVSMFANQVHRYSTTGATGVYKGVFADLGLVGDEPENTKYPSDLSYDQDGNLMLAVLGATNPPDNRGEILRYALSPGNVAGVPLAPLVEHYPSLSSAVWIASPNAIPGDYNSNGSVGPEDYLKWKNDFGKWVAKGGGADGNADGVVNAADYTVWRNAVGGPLGAGSAVAVPEPAAAILWITACSACLMFRVNRARRRPIEAATVHA